jgi:hypothetical protein
MTTAEVVHSSECASNVSEKDAAAGVWKACDCGAIDRFEAEKGAALLEERAGAYLYPAYMAYLRAGNEEKSAALAKALELIGKPVE